MSTITMEARKQAIEAAVQAARDAVAAGQQPSGTLTYKGDQITLPVTRVPLDVVLLNPRSHRIRAQIQSLPEQDAEVVTNEPFGDAGQRIISRLLAETDGFGRIRNHLERDKQLDPGVLTDAGVLINANTRAVALRELGEKYINVLVLPSDAGDKELNDIELRLQMALDVKQDYTLTSQLLFIEDLVNAGWTIDEIGRQLRPDLTDNRRDQKEAREHVERELRLLSLIRDVMQLSHGKRKFSEFDDRRQALIEIDADYQALKNAKPDEATRVRDAQLAGMLAGVDYRKLRGVDANLIDTYVPQAMSEDENLGGKVAALLTADNVVGIETLSGLDLLDEDDEIDDPTTAGVSLRKVLELIAESDEDGQVILPGDDPSEAISRTSFVGSVNVVFTTALKIKDQDAIAGDVLQAPAKYLANAARAIDNAIDSFQDVRNDANFDLDAFNRAKDGVTRALDQLDDVLAEKLSGTPIDDLIDE